MKHRTNADTGAERVARFSRGLWVAGGIAVLALAVVATPAVWFDPDTDEIIVEQPEWRAGGSGAVDGGEPPWEAADADDAVFEDGMWHGTGPARIVLTGLEPGEPLRLTSPNELLRPVRAWVFTSFETPGDPDAAPVNLRLFREENFLIPVDTTAVLWVAPRGDHRWELHIAEAELPERSGLVEGSGPSAFRYRGDATAARASLEQGIGNEVRVFGAGEETVTEFAEGRGARTISWPDPGPGGAVIVIDTALPDDEWSLQLHDREAAVGYGGSGPADREPRGTA